MGPKAFLKNCQENIPFIMKDLPYMPRLMNEVLFLAKQNFQNESVTHKKLKPSQRNLSFLPRLGCVAIGLGIGVWAYPYLPQTIVKQDILWFVAGVGFASIFSLLMSGKKS